jgi:hypothetical protein
MVLLQSLVFPCLFFFFFFFTLFLLSRSLSFHVDMCLDVVTEVESAGHELGDLVDNVEREDEEHEE